MSQEINKRKGKIELAVIDHKLELVSGSEVTHEKEKINEGKEKSKQIKRNDSAKLRNR